ASVAPTRRTPDRRRWSARSWTRSPSTTHVRQTRWRAEAHDGKPCIRLDRVKSPRVTTFPRMSGQCMLDHDEGACFNDSSSLRLFPIEGARSLSFLAGFLQMIAQDVKKNV